MTTFFEPGLVIVASLRPSDCTKRLITPHKIAIITKATTAQIIRLLPFSLASSLAPPTIKNWNIPHTKTRKPIPIINGISTVLVKVKIVLNKSPKAPPAAPPPSAICAEAKAIGSKKIAVEPANNLKRCIINYVIKIPIIVLFLSIQKKTYLARILI